MFSQRELKNVLINAILRGAQVPERRLSNEFKRARYNRVARALLSRNLLIPLTKRPAVAAQGDVVTGYSQPLQEAVMLWGFTWTNPNTQPSSDDGRMLKLNIEGRELIQNVAASMIPLTGIDTTIGFSLSELGWGVSTLPAPIIIPAGARVVAQFSYNPSSGYTAFVANPSQYDSVLLLCLAVKTCISDEDRGILEECERFIETHEYQVPVTLNMITPPTDSNLSITWNGTNGGGDDGLLTTSQTRVVGFPILLRAFATNLTNSRIALRDSRGHDFTPSGMFLCRNVGPHATGGNQPLSPYFRLAVPHVLATGAQVLGEHLDGTGANLGPTAIDQFTPPAADAVPPQVWFTWTGVTP